jgi:hypothetical protein
MKSVIEEVGGFVLLMKAFAEALMRSRLVSPMVCLSLFSLWRILGGTYAMAKGKKVNRAICL